MSEQQTSYLVDENVKTLESSYLMERVAELTLKLRQTEEENETLRAQVEVSEAIRAVAKTARSFLVDKYRFSKFADLLQALRNEALPDEYRFTQREPIDVAVVSGKEALEDARE